MNFLIFQHVPYESPGFIPDWIQEHGHSCTFVNFYDDPGLPVGGKYDGLIIMGGPMNVYDDEECSWLESEKEFIKRFIQSGKKVLGICLGAQMVADALGAEVYKNKHLEIGWFPVKVDQEHLPSKYANVFPDDFVTFHWHGDTFEIPDKVVGFISSEACANQAFILDNVAAFQFHMEMTQEGMNELVRHNELIFEQSYPFIQPREKLLDTTRFFDINQSVLYKFLNKFFAD